MRRAFTTNHVMDNGFWHDATDRYSRSGRNGYCQLVTANQAGSYMLNFEMS